MWGQKLPYQHPFVPLELQDLLCNNNVTSLRRQGTLLQMRLDRNLWSEEGKGPKLGFLFLPGMELDLPRLEIRVSVSGLNEAASDDAEEEEEKMVDNYRTTYRAWKLIRTCIQCDDALVKNP
jgi:hypothetical protein